MSTNPQQLRQHTVSVNVGGVIVGGGAPIVVQSMTNTDTADVEQTARQVAALARAGSELVRVTVDRDQAAAAVPHIKERLGQLGVSEMRIVSPMPCCSNTPMAAADATMPLVPMPASVRPRCSA